MSLLKLKSIFSPTAGDTKFQDNQSNLQNLDSIYDDGLGVPIKSNLQTLDSIYDDGLDVPIKSNLQTLDSALDDGLNKPIQSDLQSLNSVFKNELIQRSSDYINNRVDNVNETKFNYNEIDIINQTHGPNVSMEIRSGRENPNLDTLLRGIIFEPGSLSPSIIDRKLFVNDINDNPENHPFRTETFDPRVDSAKTGTVYINTGKTIGSLQYGEGGVFTNVPSFMQKITDFSTAGLDGNPFTPLGELGKSPLDGMSWESLYNSNHSPKDNPSFKGITPISYQGVNRDKLNIRNPEDGRFGFAGSFRTSAISAVGKLITGLDIGGFVGSIGEFLKDSGKEPYIVSPIGDVGRTINFNFLDRGTAVAPAITDAFRIAKFLTSPAGVLFIGKQEILSRQGQKFKPSYNPFSSILTAATKGLVGAAVGSPLFDRSEPNVGAFIGNLLGLGDDSEYPNFDPKATPTLAGEEIATKGFTLDSVRSTIIDVSKNVFSQAAMGDLVGSSLGKGSPIALAERQIYTFRQRRPFTFSNLEPVQYGPYADVFNLTNPEVTNDIGQNVDNFLRKTKKFGFKKQGVAIKNGMKAFDQIRKQQFKLDAGKYDHSFDSDLFTPKYGETNAFGESINFLSYDLYDVGNGSNPSLILAELYSRAYNKVFDPTMTSEAEYGKEASYKTFGIPQVKQDIGGGIGRGDSVDYDQFIGRQSDESGDFSTSGLYDMSLNNMYSNFPRPTLASPLQKNLFNPFKENISTSKERNSFRNDYLINTQATRKVTKSETHTKKVRLKSVIPGIPQYGTVEEEKIVSEDEIYNTKELKRIGDRVTLSTFIKGNSLSYTANTYTNNNEGETIKGEASVDLESEEHGMPFYFKDMRDNSYTFFRAYLEGLTENISPSYTATNYIGRSEPVYTYERGEREINFTLKLFAHNNAELAAIYQKMNKLTSLCYPEYLKDVKSSDESTQLVSYGNRMVAPFTKFRLGEMFGSTNAELMGYIKSLNYSVDQASPWNTTKDFRVPRYVTATIGYQVIHSKAPNINTNFYGCIEKAQNTYKISDDSDNTVYGGGTVRTYGLREENEYVGRKR